MLLSYLCFATATGGLAIAAWWIARVLLAGTPYSIRLLGSLVGFSILATLVLQALGWIGWLHREAIAIAVVALELGLWLVLRTRLATTAHQRVQSEGTQTRDPGRLKQPAWLLGACVGLSISAAWATLYRHLHLPMKFAADDLSYHATMPAHWLQEGRFFLAPPDYHGYFPGNAELFTLLFVAPTRLVSFGVLAGLYWLALAVLAVHALAKELGATTRLAILAATLILTSPPFNEHAASYSATDLAAGALLCTATVFAIRASKTAAPSNALALAGYAGASAGLGSGCKITAILPAGLLGVYLVGQAARHDSLGRAARTAAVFAGTCIVGGGAWYLRNWLLTGNPAFPAEIAWFEGPLDQASQARTSLWTQLSQLEARELPAALEQLFDWPIPTFSLAAIGYLLTLFVYPRALARRSPIPGLLLVWLVGLSLLLLIVRGPFSGTANQEHGELTVRLRFFLLVVALGLVLAVSAFSRLPGRTHLIGTVLLLLGAWILDTSSRAIALAWVLGGACVWPSLAGKLPDLRPMAGRLAWLGKRAWLLLPLLLSYGLASSLFLDLTRKSEEEPVLQEQLARWQLVERLPPGTRVACLSDKYAWQYFGLFGKTLQYVPLSINRRGELAQPLHANWRRERPRWWVRKRERKTIGNFVETLRQSRVEAILLIRAKKRSFSKQYRELIRSPHAKRIARERGAVLFSIAP